MKQWHTVLQSTARHRPWL